MSYKNFVVSNNCLLNESTTSNCFSVNGFDYNKDIYEIRVFDSAFGKPHVLPGTFVYRDKNDVVRRVSIERVIYSNPATVVIWDDGTKTVCKCFADDQYNPETGLTVCILKKLVGASAVKDTITAWLPNADYKPGSKIVRALRDVRDLFRKK